MLKTVRKERLSWWAAALITLPIGLFMFVLMGCMCWGGRIAAGELLGPFLSGEVIVSLLCAFTVIGAWLPTRFCFLALRWRDVEVEDTFCSNCSYNLTGICPECGELIEESRMNASLAASERSRES